MEWEKIISKLRTPETLNEGLVELESYKANRDTQIEKLTTSNETYKETNANLAMKISATVNPATPEKSEEEIESERLEGEFENMIKEMRE